MKATNLKTKEEVVKCFEQLRLPGAKEKYLELESLPNSGEMTLTEQLGILLQHELDTRSAKRLERLVRESGLRKNAAFTSARLESLIDEKERGFRADEIRRLASCDWIRQPAPPAAIITGASGTGKTWLACMIGRCACEQGLTVSYYRFPDFLERLADAQDHHESASFRKALSFKKLLIIDDLGIGTVSTQQASEFLSVVEARFKFGAMIIAGQLDPSEWYGYFGGCHEAEALTDRLLNYSFQISLKGASLREREKPTL